MPGWETIHSALTLAPSRVMQTTPCSVNKVCKNNKEEEEKKDDVRLRFGSSGVMKKKSNYVFLQVLKKVRELVQL